MADGNRRWPDKALTAVAVRNAKPGKHYDGHGLYLRVEPTGAKRWVQRLVIRGKSHEIGLGSAGLVTLAEARGTALANRKLARSGGDPLAARREAEAVPTFAEAVRTVHAAHAPTWRNPKHAAQFLATLETYAFPHFGATKVSDISSADVLAALAPIWVKLPETARRVRQRIGTVMKWTIAKGWRKDNPAEAIALALPRHNRRQEPRKALPYTEVTRCLETVRASGASRATKLAIELMVLCANRPGEVRGAQRDEVDLDRAEWLIPGTRMKAGKSHRVPLSPRAVAVIREAMTLDDGSGLLFPGAKHGRPVSENTFVKLLRELGFDADAHGFRASFKTWSMEATSCPPQVAEFALAHVTKDKAQAAYERSDLYDRRRALMREWADFLARPADA